LKSRRLLRRASFHVLCGIRINFYVSRPFLVVLFDRKPGFSFGTALRAFKRFGHPVIRNHCFFPEFPELFQLPCPWLVEKNCKEIPEMVSIGENLGIDTISFKSLRKSRYSLTESEERFYQAQLNILKKENSKITGCLKKSKNPGKECFLHWLWGVVTSKGDVLACCWYQNRIESHKLGNIFEEKFHEIYKKSKSKKLDFSKCNDFDCRFHIYNKVFNEYKELSKNGFI